jgi:CRISPR/Cas system-associated endoribonuclease Cas2
MKSEIPCFIVSADAKELAKAILKEDATAADALVDWILENRNHRGFSVIKYTEQLEDTLREIKRHLNNSLKAGANNIVLDNNASTEIYRLMWKCIQHARTLGREGMQ